MKDYKNTLNLPHTRFPMKANLAQREPSFLSYWNDIKLYQKLREQGKGKKKYLLHDGPPYANGQIHLGHAVNKILKDIILKFKTLSGFDAPYVPGWDCHGLPIELNVEKKLGKAGHNVSVEDFREACRHYAAKQVDIQREAFKRLGVLGDWDNPYLTMDRQYEANIVRALAHLLDKGHLQQGQKPVHWCVDCQSALAEAEVEYQDKISIAIDVKFKLIEPDLLGFELDKKLPVSIVIWTTTPWTLPANEAVAVGEAIEYALVQTDNEYLLLAADLVKSTLSRYKTASYRIIHTLRGQQLDQFKLQHPLLNKTVPIVLGHHVNIETGTGAVHIAPAHGMDDFEVGLRYKLPTSNPVDTKGCYYSEAAILPNTSIFKANDKIVALLSENGMLLFQNKIEHSYPHCWRHQTPLIFRATAQWFISMDKQHLREKALNAIQNVHWMPEWGQVRIQKMIENRPDWCVSRQRVWGTPLPLLLHEKTGQIHPDMFNLMLKIANLIEAKGMDAWFNLSVEDLIDQEAKDYVKVHDTLDVWLDSGVSHACVLNQRPELAFPADLYLEGSDQYRGWFNSSLMTAIALFEVAPYKEVLTHGFTVDSHGHKMSKSLGNVVEPDKIIKTYGADILRLWVASTDYRAEMSYSDAIIKQVSDQYRRIRNTARFMLSNLWDFDPKRSFDKSTLWDLDRSAMKRCDQFQAKILNHYAHFQFHFVCKALYEFCSEDMGGFYLDIIKDRLYTMPEQSVGRRSAQFALYYILNRLVTWIAPVLSFTAEEIWQTLLEIEPRVESVFLASFLESEVEQKTQDDWSILKTVKTEVNKVLEDLRNEGKIGSPLNAKVTLYFDLNKNEKLFNQLNAINQRASDSLNEGLRFILITSEAYIKPLNGEENTLATNITGLTLSVEASEYEKCQRCWHQRKDVNQHPDFPGLCGRCVANVNTRQS